MLWRIIGSEKVIWWIGLHPNEVARFVERIGEFAGELTKAQIKATDGMLIWGDVALERICSSRLTVGTSISSQ